MMVVLYESSCTFVLLCKSASLAQLVWGFKNIPKQPCSACETNFTLLASVAMKAFDIQTPGVRRGGV